MAPLRFAYKDGAITLRLRGAAKEGRQGSVIISANSKQGAPSVRSSFNCYDVTFVDARTSVLYNTRTMDIRVDHGVNSHFFLR